MCKHFTIVPIDDKKISPQLCSAVLSLGLRESAVDGKNHHGVGIAYMKKSKPTIFKKGLSAVGYGLSEEFSRTLDELNFRAPVIGHVRKASVNLTNKHKEEDPWPDEDAHPFQSGRIILAHNGTIQNHEELKKEHKIDGNGIDSHTLAIIMGNMLDSRGKELNLETLNSVSKQCKGSFALVIQDILYPNRLYLCARLKDLHIGTVDDAFGIITTSSNIGNLVVSEINETARYLWSSRPWDEWSFEKLDDDKWYMWEKKKFAATGQLDVLGKLEFASFVTGVAGGHYTHYGGHNGPTRKYKQYTPWFEQRAEITDVAKMIIRLQNVLPLTPVEFRFLYESLNLLEGGAKFSKKEVENVVEFVYHLLSDDKLRDYLAEFLDMEISIMDDSMEYIIKRK